MSKKGQGLPLTTIIIAVLVVVVLIVIVAFFLSGSSSLIGTIRSIFIKTYAGTDMTLARQICQQRCDQATTWDRDAQLKSAFCTDAFNIDENRDGEADYTTTADGKKEYVQWFCNKPSDSHNIGVACTFTC
ncbi:MAG TPA: hypothetical protein VJB94_03060 [Candidatus Nanoarchaeia archaeon]|nr:hypothetical protein [Candidatus Nanoarchaeia archaeon]